LLRLAEVLLEALGELRVVRLPDHRRKLLHDLVLRVVDVPQLVQEELARRRHGGPPFSSRRGSVTASRLPWFPAVQTMGRRSFKGRRRCDRRKPSVVSPPR